jgi:hypothetical protein
MKSKIQAFCQVGIITIFSQQGWKNYIYTNEVRVFNRFQRLLIDYRKIRVEKYDEHFLVVTAVGENGISIKIWTSSATLIRFIHDRFGVDMDETVDDLLAELIDVEHRVNPAMETALMKISLSRIPILDAKQPSCTSNELSEVFSEEE